MSMKKCRVHVDVVPSGVRVIVMENSRLKLTILPDKGADIYRVEYKPGPKDGRTETIDLLYRTPWGLRRPDLAPLAGNSKERWLDLYPGGWQTMFPNAGAECVHDGVTQHFHGEASMVPWQFDETHGFAESADAVTIRLAARLTRAPFSLEKRITLPHDGAAFSVEETVTNEASRPVDYIWGQHITFGAPFLSEDCRLIVPNKRLITDSWQAEGDTYRLPPGADMPWPLVRGKYGETIDFSRVPGPEAKVTDMAVLTGMEEGWYVLANEALGLNVKVGWDLSVYPFVWLWQDFHGSQGYPYYGRCYAMGAELCCTTVGGLAESAARGHARRLEPGVSKTTTVTMEVYES